MQHDHPEILARLSPIEKQIMRDLGKPKPSATSAPPTPAAPTPPPSAVRTDAVVVDVVARAYHLEPADIRSANRRRVVTRAKQVCMYLLRGRGDRTYSDIGHLLGLADHSTVVYGVRRVRRQAKRDKAFRLLLTSLAAEVDALPQVEMPSRLIPDVPQGVGERLPLAVVRIVNDAVNRRLDE